MGSQMAVQFPDFALVPKDRIPVIVYEDSEQAQEIAARAINLLRFGHPAVQIIINTPRKLEEQYSGNIEYMRKMLSDAVEALSVYKGHEAPEIGENEVFGIRPPCETEPKQGSSGNINYVFQVYKA